MPWITKEGRSVEEAREAAIAEARVPEADLDIEVVNEGAKGLFGLGGEPAVVRVRPKTEATDVREAFRDNYVPPARDESRDEEDDQDEDPLAKAEVTAAGTFDDEPESAEDAEEKRTLTERQEQAAELGVEIVRGILERMEIEGEINTRIAGGTVYIEVFGDEMGILIGRSGATLEALQELVRAGIQRRLRTRQAVVVDVEAYWERRKKPREGGGRNERRGGGNRRGGRDGNRRGGRRGPREPREPREPDGNR